MNEVMYKNVDYLIEHGVNVKKSLELFGDIETYNLTLNDFLGAISEKVSNLEKFKEANDMPNYAILVHSLKSDAKYFGFTKLAEMAYEHEMKSKANNMYYVFDHFDELIAEVNSVVTIVGEYLGKIVNVYSAGVVPSNENADSILVVDDSNIVRVFIDKVFAGVYNVISANDGKEAIDYVTKDNGSIKAMLLDLNMPNVNGVEVLEYFKTNSLFNKIPVSIITGEDSNDEKKKALTYPVIEVLTKPFNERDIKRVVEKTINSNKF